LGRQRDEVGGDEVELALFTRRHAAACATFQRARHIGRAQPAGGRRAQVAGVAGHQHQLRRLHVQQACRTQVDLGVGFVVAEELGAEHGVPGQATELRHRHQQ
jgi:hypothetical protein